MRIQIADSVNPVDLKDFIDILHDEGLSKDRPIEIPSLEWIFELTNKLTSEGYALCLIEDCTGKGESVISIMHPQDY